MARKLQGQGLALSGGGYRASLFHLGVTRRLHELGILQRTTRLSTVSGGSILAGFLAHCMLDCGARRLEFGDWEEDIAAPFRRIVRRDIRTGLFIRHMVWNWIWPGPRARGLERVLLKRIGARRLVELPRAADGVEFIFLATNIEKGTPFRFTSEKIGGRTTPDDMPIARAVAASASFPPVFGDTRPPDRWRRVRQHGHGADLEQQQGRTRIRRRDAVRCRGPNVVRLTPDALCRRRP